MKLKLLFKLLVVLVLIVAPLMGQFTATGTLTSSSGGTATATVAGVTGTAGAAIAVSVGNCTGTGTLPLRSSGLNANQTTWEYYSGEIKLCNGGTAYISILLGNPQDPVVGRMATATPASSPSGPSSSSGPVT